MNYYYLKSSLPDVGLDSDPNKIDYKSIFSLIETNLSPSDRTIYEALILQNDNRNFLNILFHEYFELPYENEHRPSLLHIETLQDYRSHKADLPDYMLTFLHDHAGFLSGYSLAEIELKLRSYFSNYIDALSSPFLVTFYEWQYQIEEIISEINKSAFSFLKERGIYDVDYLRPTQPINVKIDAQKIRAELLPLIEAGEYKNVEHLVDGYYWDFAESWPSDFSADTIFAYTLKLLRLARWSMLRKETETTKGVFLPLMEELRNNKNQPKMTLI